MLKPFGREIWTADGPDVVIVGFSYPTRMAVIRLSDRSLFLWSPIMLTDALRKMAHGTAVENDARAFLRRAFRWLAP